MAERRKTVEFQELSDWRFPGTENRKRYEDLGLWIGRLYNFQHNNKHVEGLGRLDIPVGFEKEEQQLVDEGIEKITTLHPIIGSSLEQVVDIFKQEQEKLRPVLIREVRLLPREQEQCVSWAEEVSSDFEILLVENGHACPDPHADAEASYVFHGVLSSLFVQLGQNFVRTDRAMLGDPDGSFSYSSGKSTNDFQIKRLFLTLALTGDFVNFVYSHTGDTLLQVDEHDNVDQGTFEGTEFGNKVFRFLYDYFEKLDKTVRTNSRIYRDELVNN